MSRVVSLLAALALLAGAPAHAAVYAVDYAKSQLAFAGTHAGNAFSGTFGAWQADIRFDAADLPGSRIGVTIDMASAKTGNAMYDGTLPTPDWFDVKNHPQATFTSERIEAAGEGEYAVQGMLTLRGKAQKLGFTFRPEGLGTPQVKTRFSLPLDRLALGVGVQSDGKAEWVSQTITLTTELVANPK
jgi:polyisoprenoid-binding protein YceI